MYSTGYLRMLLIIFAWVPHFHLSQQGFIRLSQQIFIWVTDIFIDNWPNLHLSWWWFKSRSAYSIYFSLGSVVAQINLETHLSPETHFTQQAQIDNSVNLFNTIHSRRASTSLLCSSSQLPPNDCLVPIKRTFHFALLIIPWLPSPLMNTIIEYLLNMSVHLVPFTLLREQHLSVDE